MLLLSGCNESKIMKAYEKLQIGSNKEAITYTCLYGYSTTSCPKCLDAS